MNRYNMIVAAVAVAVAAACATPNPQAPQAPQAQDDKGYVTGSRLPVRNGSGTTADVKGVSGRDAMDEMRRNTVSSPPPMPGK
jgi:hypothetical protein